MLERMQSVPWGSLTHARGTAGDLPELLLRVAGPSTEVRRDALRRLYETILHQGAIWESTSYTVPFLIELLALPRTGDKEYLLVMLGNIGRAGLPSLVGTPHVAGASKPVIPGREVGWVRSARESVTRGRELCASFLSSPVPSLRACAAFATALTGPPDHRLAQIFRDKIASEVVDVPRASMVIGLNHMDDLLDGILFQDLRARSPGAITRWAAAAVQVARWEKQSAPEAIDELVRSLSIGAMVKGVYGGLPWGSGNMVADTAGVLSAVGPGAVPVVVPRLLQAFLAAGEQTALLLAEVILILSFRVRLGALERPAPYQQEVLATFAASARLGSASPLGTLLAKFGLPQTTEGLKAVVHRSGT